MTADQTREIYTDTDMVKNLISAYEAPALNNVVDPVLNEDIYITSNLNEPFANQRLHDSYNSQTLNYDVISDLLDIYPSKNISNEEEENYVDEDNPFIPYDVREYNGRVPYEMELESDFESKDEPRVLSSVKEEVFNLQEENKLFEKDLMEETLEELIDNVMSNSIRQKETEKV